MHPTKTVRIHLEIRDVSAREEVEDLVATIRTLAKIYAFPEDITVVYEEEITAND